MAPKWLDLDEFQKSGLLQEVNRQFFHPLGLALAVSVNDQGKVVGIPGIQDSRADQQGMVFSSIGREHILRADNVTREQQRRAAIRQAALGYVIQPIPSPTGSEQTMGNGAVEVVLE